MKKTFKKLLKKFLSGKPTELTEASEGVYLMRKVLEGDCVFLDEDGNDIDVGGCVFWNERKTVAVYASWD